MKKVLITLGIGALVFVALVGAGVAYAQSTTPPSPEDFTPPAWGPSGMMGGRGFAGHMGGYAQTGEYGLMHDTMVATFAEALGIDVAELEERLANGETMFTIAESLGYSAEEFQTLMLEARELALQEAVASGLITQEQADWMLDHMQTGLENGYGPGSGACDGSGSMMSNGRGAFGYGQRGGGFRQSAP